VLRYAFRYDLLDISVWHHAKVDLVHFLHIWIVVTSIYAAHPQFFGGNMEATDTRKYIRDPEGLLLSDGHPF